MLSLTRRCFIICLCACLITEAGPLKVFKKTRFFRYLGYYYGSHYIIPAYDAIFDLELANYNCHYMEGYLLELNHPNEMELLYFYIDRQIWWTRHFTGGNDFAQHGNFVYVESGKPVPSSIWQSGEPNNQDGNEHCTYLDMNRHGLKDIKCESYGRYICEVPE